MEADPNYSKKLEKTASSDSLNKLSDGASSSSSSKDDKGDNNTQEAPKKKPKKSKDQDPYAPTPTQVHTMLEEMLLLEQIGIDEVREAEEIILDDGNGEEDEIPMELLDRAEKIKRRNRDLQKRRDGDILAYLFIHIFEYTNIYVCVCISLHRLSRYDKTTKRATNS